MALVTDDDDDKATPVVVAIFVTTGMLDANIMLGAAIKAFEEPTLEDIVDGAEGLMPRDDVGNGTIATADCAGLDELTEPPLVALGGD
jgi:hypothetical protein